MEASQIQKGRTYSVRIYGGRTGQGYEATVVDCLGKLQGITYQTTSRIRERIRELCQEDHGKGLRGVRTREGGYHFIVRTGTEERPAYYCVTSRHFVRPWAEEQAEREQYTKLRDERQADRQRVTEQAEAQVETLAALGIESAGFAYYHGSPCLFIPLEQVQVMLDAIMEAVQ